MRKKLNLLTIALACALAGTATAKQDDGDVLRATLDNGMRVVIVRDTLAPVVTSEINYLVGSDEVPEAFPGSAHALEHMMFRGSPGLSKDQLAAVAANMGGTFNADTTQSVTQYYFVAPSGDLDVALHTEALRMRGLDIDDAEWVKERGAIEQEVSRDMSSPNYKFYSQMQAQLFDGTPYAHTPLGTRESFDRTTAEMLRQFHNAWYVPNNAILVIAGDVDPAATLAKVKTQFGNIPRKPLPARPAFHFNQPSAKTVQLPTDSPYGSVYLAYRWPGLHDADYAVSIVLQKALGSHRAALFDMGMTGKALFAGFFAQSMPEAGVGQAVAIFPRGGDPQPVLKQMQSILADAAVKGIDPALVETAKSNAIAELDFKKNSVDGLANAWSEALAFEGVDSPDSIKQAIEAVTPDAVNALAKRTFDPAHAVTAILTPESSGKPSEGKGFGGAESFASSPDKPVALPDWAAKAFAKIELPHSTIHPVSYTLPNGLRVIVQPESISDTVEVFGKIRTNQDMQSTKEDQGVADVLGGLFPFGTTSLDRLKLESALDALNAKMSAGSNFTLSIPSMHFAEGMKLLADNELHPALPPQAFGVVQQQISGVIAGQLQSPDFLFYQGINRALFPANDLQLRYPTPDTLKALTLDKVKAYYRKTFRPDLATIVIVGKVDPAQARDVVAKAFGTWKVEGPKPDVDYVAVPANRGSQLQVPDATSLQDTVQMKQTLDVFTHDDVRFALTVGNAVLGGGFYASRLYHDLRDKSGLVYNVSSAFELFPHRSTYAVTFGCDPDKVAPAAAMVVRDLKQMQDEPVAADDLQRAKSIVLRQLSLGESSFASIGQNLLSYAVENKPLDEDTIAAHHYFKMTAAQIQQAYRLHVRPDAFVIGVKGPAPK